ncbi:hypothetical protein PR048_020720 [Dryococelus australis]|uniref:DNA-directed DNA polymerase n=1 Tax=Dryococelus australis TaxID=614101 RepID=A0ABQ9H725_9NEOP|nr:hypothetical protein PR048_020720 [Dryococelus australis]
MVDVLIYVLEDRCRVAASAQTSITLTYAQLQERDFVSLRGRNEMDTEQRQNAKYGETGGPRENPLTSGIVRHDSHVGKSGSDPTWSLTPLAKMGVNALAAVSPQSHTRRWKLSIISRNMSPLKDLTKAKIIKQSKLILTLAPWKKHVIHGETLKHLLMYWAKLDSVHRVLHFEQKPWMDPYIEFNIEKCAQAGNEFEKSFFKLMNRSIYGKTLQNVRRERDIRVISRYDTLYGAVELLGRISFQARQIINENLVLIEMSKSSVAFNKPLYIGLCHLHHKWQHHTANDDYLPTPHVAQQTTNQTTEPQLLSATSRTAVCSIYCISNESTSLYPLDMTFLPVCLTARHLTTQVCDHLSSQRGQTLLLFQDVLRPASPSDGGYQLCLWCIENHSTLQFRQATLALLLQITPASFRRVLLPDLTAVGDCNILCSPPFSLQGAIIYNRHISAGCWRYTVVMATIATLAPLAAATCTTLYRPRSSVFLAVCTTRLSSRLDGIEVRIVPDDTAGWQVFSRVSSFSHHYFLALLYIYIISPSSALKTSMLTASETFPLHSPHMKCSLGGGTTQLPISTSAILT